MRMRHLRTFNPVEQLRGHGLLEAHVPGIAGLDLVHGQLRLEIECNSAIAIMANLVQTLFDILQSHSDSPDYSVGSAFPSTRSVDLLQLLRPP